MSALRPAETLEDSFAPVLLANLAPLVGVVALGWDAAALAVLYAVEVLFSLALAGFEALFAQRHPPEERDGVVSVGDAELIDKRGSVTVVEWLPPVYPRTVPFVAGVVTGVGWFTLFVGVVAVSTVDAGAALARTDVLLSLAGLVVTGVGGSARRYFARREYEEVSPYGVIETPARRVFFLVFLVLPVAQSGGLVLLAALVVGKVAVEYSAHRADDGETGGLTGWLAGPDGGGERPEPVTVPDGDPVASFPTDRRTVLVAASLRTLRRAAPGYAVLCFFIWVFGTAFVGGDDAPLAVVAGITAGVVLLYFGALAVRVGSSYLRFAPLEYRRYDDRIVAHDAWLEEPQWSVSVREMRNLNVLTDRLADRLTGTRTVRFTHGWSDDETERQIGPVADYERLVDAFELPVADTEFDPLDRRAVAAAVALAVVYAAGVVAVLLSPGLDADAVFLAVFALPFVAMFVNGIWRRSYPDRVDRSPDPSWRD
ncbi:DUF6498-containing protein [Halosimplex halophilum]|uniref:DUF6498-containing protein n=1 Tax=Halosimplex halophilum TaxID=2559572 RepID=UPI00107F5186|nr:DUF6498-containing protein [Halosimplex halophilum]